MSGAVTRQLAVGGRTLNLVFKFGTIRMAERELGGRTVFAALSEGLSADAISAIFWAVLQPSTKITREGADDLIDEVGPQALIAELTQGLADYFGADAPDAGDAEGNALAGTKAATPKKARRRS